MLLAGINVGNDNLVSLFLHPRHISVMHFVKKFTARGGSHAVIRSVGQIG
jgi:hypothetical protein